MIYIVSILVQLSSREYTELLTRFLTMESNSKLFRVYYSNCISRETDRNTIILYGTNNSSKNKVLKAIDSVREEFQEDVKDITFNIQVVKANNYTI